MKILRVKEFSPDPKRETRGETREEKREERIEKRKREETIEKRKREEKIEKRKERREEAKKMSTSIDDAIEEVMKTFPPVDQAWIRQYGPELARLTMLDPNSFCIDLDNVYMALTGAKRRSDVINRKLKKFFQEGVEYEVVEKARVRRDFFCSFVLLINGWICVFA